VRVGSRQGIGRAIARPLADPRGRCSAEGVGRERLPSWSIDVAVTSSSSARSLEGRVALVTGAGRGVGRGVAEALAGTGARVAVCARSEPQLEETLAALRAIGAVAEAFPLDITDPARVAHMFELVAERLGPVDLLVNNAGIMAEGSLVELAEEDVAGLLATNVHGPFRCAQHAARHMIGRGGGKIINIASAFALTGVSGFSAYAMTKGALLALTRTLAVELAGDGIQVNAVAPGHVKTDMTREALADAAIAARVLRKIPARRVAEPAEIGELVCYLASPAADFITGEVIVIDGGFTVA
jgi:NAD(P)-dependent dehydrogenase (short-subunit alcohol dehydrogenase family)